jgi:hypothetical protein
LPESYSNSRKIRTISGSAEKVIPVRIKKLSATAEKQIIRSLMLEINEQYGLDLDINPTLDRCSGAKNNKSNDGEPQSRLIVISASHANRLVGGLAENSQNIVNITKPGWTASDENIDELKSKLSKVSPGVNDFIILDPISNDTFCGTDTKGNPVDPVKIGGTWHITGQLSVRPKNYIKATLSQLKFISSDYPDCKIIIMMPLPRYILKSCCVNPEHVSNLKDPNYCMELQQDLDTVEDLLTAWAQSLGNESTLIHFRSVADVPEADLSELRVNGATFWQEPDPVHAGGGSLCCNHSGSPC